MSDLIDLTKIISDDENIDSKLKPNIIKSVEYVLSNEHMKTYVNLSCWHENNYESEAMWKLYLKSNEGIAIQSTFARLRDCFEENSKPVLIGEVKYIDYDSDTIDGDTLIPFLHKRKSFEHEHELRALIIGSSECNISISLDILIENVYVSPTAPEWFSDLVRSVLHKYGFSDVKVLKSDLSKKPLY